MKKLILLLIVSFVVQSANGQIVVWEVAEGGNGHGYQFVAMPDKITWLDANDLAESYGGHLVSVTSIEEHNFLLENVLSPSAGISIIIGLYKDGDGVWKWTTGESFSFQYWRSTEPNGRVGEDFGCYTMYDSSYAGFSDLYNDDASNPRAFVIEYETIPEPTHEWYMYPVNGHQYTLTTNHSNWVDAEAEAVSVGGHLVTVNDEAESNWLLDTSSNPFGLQYARDYHGGSNWNLIWIGLEHIDGDRMLPSSWAWQNGEPVTFWNIDSYLYIYDNGDHMYMAGPFHPTIPGKWNCEVYQDVVPARYLRGIIEVVPGPSIEVAFDIKPQSCPNPLNVYSRGVLPVAILGSEDFDVSTIDAVSVRLNGVAPIRHSYEDVTAPVVDANDCNCTTDGPDGYVDLTLKFRTQAIVDTLGDVNDGDVLTLTVEGVLTDETPIDGSDCVSIIGKHKPLNRADINKDGKVDLTDFAIFSENWLQSSIVQH
ncbi:MAG: hypothetical protein FVQ85_04490 [Planctomycetes bacterium]|nr:hypothetical protein [Planctomycetota bacterium]